MGKEVYRSLRCCCAQHSICPQTWSKVPASPPDDSPRKRGRSLGLSIFPGRTSPASSSRYWTHFFHGTLTAVHLAHVEQGDTISHVPPLQNISLGQDFPSENCFQGMSSDDKARLVLLRSEINLSSLRGLFPPYCQIGKVVKNPT